MLTSVRGNLSVPIAISELWLSGTLGVSEMPVYEFPRVRSVHVLRRNLKQDLAKDEDEDA